MIPDALCVRVPATTANLGPGFDVLGMALEEYLVFDIARSPVDRVQWGDESQLDDPSQNLVIRALDAVFSRLGERRPTASIRCRSPLPVSRGLGSSAAAVVGGALAANTWLGEPLGRQSVLEICSALEGHPDNVAPALLGGATVAVASSAGIAAVNIPLHPRIWSELALLAIIPPYRLATASARAVLPKQVTFKDAVFNTGRAALLVATLATGTWEALPEALADRLHQPYRAALQPQLLDLPSLIRQFGGFGLTLSGAGPALIAWCPAPAARNVEQALAAALGPQVRLARLAICQQGAIVN